MKTNHKWNILNIMRYYTRINKPFNAEIYIRFITPNDQAHSPAKNAKNVPTLSQALLMVRRHIENGWSERVGDYVVITEKGRKALEAWEKTRYIQQASVSNETLRRRRLKQD